MPLVRLWPVRAQAVDDLKEKWRRRAASNKCAVGAAVVARHELATSLYRAAMSPGGQLAAVGGLDRRIRLIDLEIGALVEEVDWHGAPVWGLAWAGTLLVSGDGDGRVGVWDFADRLRVPASEKEH